MTLYFSAGGLGDGAAADQDDRIERQTVCRQHRGPDRADDRGKVGMTFTNDFVHED